MAHRNQYRNNREAASDSTYADIARDARESSVGDRSFYPPPYSHIPFSSILQQPQARPILPVNFTQPRPVLPVTFDQHRRPPSSDSSASRPSPGSDSEVEEVGYYRRIPGAFKAGDVPRHILDAIPTMVPPFEYQPPPHAYETPPWEKWEGQNGQREDHTANPAHQKPAGPTTTERKRLDRGPAGTMPNGTVAASPMTPHANQATARRLPNGHTSTSAHPSRGSQAPSSTVAGSRTPWAERLPNSSGTARAPPPPYTSDILMAGPATQAERKPRADKPKAPTAPPRTRPKPRQTVADLASKLGPVTFPNKIPVKAGGSNIVNNNNNTKVNKSVNVQNNFVITNNMAPAAVRHRPRWGDLPPPPPPLEPLPLKNLNYETLQTHLAAGAVLRLHYTGGRSPLTWTGTEATSGFSAPSPAFTALSPATYGEALQDIGINEAFGHRLFATEMAAKHVKNRQESTPWISTTSNLDFAIWATARTLAKGEHDAVHMTVIMPSSEVRVTAASLLDHAHGDVPAEQAAALRKAAGEGETLFYGRIFAESVEHDLLWTVDAIPFALPPKLWRSASSRPLVGGWLENLRWDVHVDSWAATALRLLSENVTAWDEQPVRLLTAPWPPTSKSESAESSPPALPPLTSSAEGGSKATASLKRHLTELAEIADQLSEPAPLVNTLTPSASSAATFHSPNPRSVFNPITTIMAVHNTVPSAGHHAMPSSSSRTEDAANRLQSPAFRSIAPPGIPPLFSVNATGRPMINLAPIPLSTSAPPPPYSPPTQSLFATPLPSLSLPLESQQARHATFFDVMAHPLAATTSTPMRPSRGADQLDPLFVPVARATSPSLINL